MSHRWFDLMKRKTVFTLVGLFALITLAPYIVTQFINSEENQNYLDRHLRFILSGLQVEAEEVAIAATWQGLLVSLENVALKDPFNSRVASSQKITARVVWQDLFSQTPTIAVNSERAIIQLQENLNQQLSVWEDWVLGQKKQ